MPPSDSLVNERTDELVLTHPEPPPAPAPRPAPRETTADDVRYRWENGWPSAFPEPLLPLLLLTEPGAEWIWAGVRRYAELMLGAAATGYGRGRWRRLAAAQVDGPLRSWALEQVGPGTDAETARKHQALGVHLRRSRDPVLWVDAYGPVFHATTIVDRPAWPSMLHIARRLVDGPHAYQRRRAVEAYAAPLEQLGALAWRWP